ncbi:hypothetical protein [Fontivita pretiosa]|uniref:hypothetical protein n=1 Tax=Fontivita pretiosa TaxID=2989684 RepID=UPI003D16DD02
MTLGPDGPRSTIRPSPAALPGDPRRRAREWLARQLHGWQRWTQRSLTRENFIAGLKTLSWLAPLTLIIWIYAEREQIDRIDQQQIPVQVISTITDRYVELRRMVDTSVIADLSGPKGRLEEIRQKVMLRNGTPSVVITIDDANLSPGQIHELDTAALLASTRVFAGSGVTIGKCSPARLPVFVDVYVERSLDVQPPPDVTNLVGTPIFEPSRVTVRAPRHVIEEIEKQQPGGLTVVADLSQSGVLDDPGSHTIDKVPVRLSLPRAQLVALAGPAADSISFMPATVKATIQVRDADVRWVYPVINVYIGMQQNLQAAYKVECAPTVPNVPIIGPPEQIQFLQQEDSPKPKAWLEVSRADLPAGEPRSGRLRFEFPRGAEDVRVDPEFAARPFDYKLVELPAER